MKLLIASNNPGKMQEIQRLTWIEGLELVLPREASISSQFEVEETGKTFEENAVLKATEYARAAGLYALADDSGLEVEALQGAPGIYSKRFVGEKVDDAGRIAFLLDKLKAVPEKNRAAQFVAAVALAAPDGSILSVKRGTCPGRIAFAPRGSNGFGYDPIFLVGESGRTMAELENREKDEVSHRGNALRAIKADLAKIVL